MLTAIVVVAVLVVLLIAAVAATHEGDLLLDAPVDNADLALPTLMIQPEDIAEVRFGMALRGYRMDEVDSVLARLAAELAGRDAQITKLQDALVEAVEPALAQVEAEVAAEQAPATPSWVKPAPHNPAPTVVAWSPTRDEPVEEPAPLEALEPDDDHLVEELVEASAPDVVAEVLSAQPAPVAVPEPMTSPFADDDFPEVLAPEDAPLDLPEAQEPPPARLAPPAEPRTWSTPPSALPTSPPVQAPLGGEDETDA